MPDVIDDLEKLATYQDGAGILPGDENPVIIAAVAHIRTLRGEIDILKDQNLKLGEAKSKRRLRLSFRKEEQ